MSLRIKNSQFLYKFKIKLILKLNCQYSVNAPQAKVIVVKFVSVITFYKASNITSCAY